MSQAKTAIPPVWTTGWTDILHTGTWRSATPVYEKKTSPCQAYCPVHGEIPVWIQYARDKDYYKAWLTLIKNNPFPSITGRVCHHPCESACNRGEYDGAISINALEQSIGDLAIREGWSLPSSPTNEEACIAVIGGGPAGLSCAYQLRRLGYGVKIFEKNEELGGVLRYGIPNYRLPEEIVLKEIERVLELGIEVLTGTTITGDTLTDLKNEYAGICIAIGASQAKMLPQFPMDNDKVLNGLQFLYDVKQNTIPPLGPDVAVIGGGSVAMDVARTARRLGKQVKVLALEDRQSLPAQQEEIQEALEESITILDGVMVQETTDQASNLRLSCVKVTLDSSSPPGVLKPNKIPGSDFELDASSVILAVGQDPQLSDFSTSGLQINNSLLEVDSNQVTSEKGIFACGDAASTERYVSRAVSSGKKTAQSIEAFLKDCRMTEEINESTSETVSFNEINTFYFPKTPRVDRETLSPEIRLQDFREVTLSLSEEDFQIQAERCFSCGQCQKCDNCYYFCPDQAVIKNTSQNQDYSINEQYCKGCGLCVEECPRGAVALKEVER